MQNNIIQSNANAKFIHIANKIHPNDMQCNAMILQAWSASLRNPLLNNYMSIQQTIQSNTMQNAHRLTQSITSEYVADCSCSVAWPPFLTQAMHCFRNQPEVMQCKVMSVNVKQVGWGTWQSIIPCNTNQTDVQDNVSQCIGEWWCCYSLSRKAKDTKMVHCL